MTVVKTPGVLSGDSGLSSATASISTALSSTSPTTFMASDGDGYELQMGRWSRKLAPRIIEFASIVTATRVLDVGCGTGHLSFALARDFPLASVRGIDLSPAYIKHAQRNDEPRLEFQVRDACALPFPNDTFDHVFSMLALQFIPRAELAIREMRRVTRPGGTIVAATWDTRGGLVALRMIFDIAAVLERDGHERRAAAYTRPMSRPGTLPAHGVAQV
jgi:SAM-dependent methyltransferase